MLIFFSGGCSTIRSIFSICFSESCMLFILVFSSAVGLFNPRFVSRRSCAFLRVRYLTLFRLLFLFSLRSRKIHWDLSLNLLLVLVLLVIPLVQSFLITRYRSTNGESSLPHTSSVPLFDPQI